MIVRDLEEAERTDRRVVAENWESTRLLLKGDGMGFSFHITTIYPGTETCIWYKNHLESVYCIEGEGEVEVLAGKEGDSKAEVENGGVAERSTRSRPAPSTFWTSTTATSSGPRPPSSSPASSTRPSTERRSTTRTGSIP